MIEERIEQQIQTRLVTQFRITWSEQKQETHGAFAFQLILDGGVDMYTIHPTAEEADVLLQLLHHSEHTTFDLERKILVFNNLAVDY